MASKGGEATAAKITEESSSRGTAMHKILEKYILEEGYLDLTNVGKQAHNMAIRVIEQGLCNLTEYYGTECTLYYPGALSWPDRLSRLTHKGQDAIIDFKQTNKPKREEWIRDYFLQLGAYAMAHNFIYKTNITKGVMMCSKDNYYQEFVVEGTRISTMSTRLFKEGGHEYYQKRAEMLDKIANMYYKTGRYEEDVEEKVVSRCQECGKKI